MACNARTFPSSAEEEICITGISGEFPKSKNIDEFEYNLYNKIDMVDDTCNRWTSKSPELPKRMGTIGTLAKFDAQFFGIHFKQAHVMDPQGRMLIEKAYESILDAGIHPKAMRDTKTGVFIGVSFVESENTSIYEKNVEGGFGLTGCSRSMLANRISYALDLHGPSVTIDTACSSSLYSLDFAFTAMRNGECDAAIVGGVNLLLCPSYTQQFARLGVLDKDGICRPFDVNSSGYSRSETVCVILLQKAKDAKRVYAKVIYSKTNSDGYKVEGITYPSSKGQQRLLSEFYRSINIDPATVPFVEGHSTGTIAGDPEECDALSAIFCKNRKDPLLVGAVKSNMGHSEAASSMCSIAKIILACDRSEVAPNINFTSIRKGVKSLENNQLKVCTETTKLVDPLIGVSAFGFGGSSAHALLSQNSKTKINNGAPSDFLPRLVTWSGRTEQAVSVVFEALSKKSLDVEFIGLLHNIQSIDEPGFIYRGYTILEHQNGSNAICLESSTRMYNDAKRPIIFMFSGMGGQWNRMGCQLLKLPLFKSTIDKCHKVLLPFGVDLISTITSDDKYIFDNALNSFVGLVAIQIGITDILRQLEISPDYIIGHSVGEISCGYADGALSLEEAMLSAYYRGFASLAAKNLIPKGVMAAVGKGYADIKSMLPDAVEVACRNSSQSCTISGPEKSVRNFLNQMRKLNIFVREVNSTGIPYHSRYIKEIGRILIDELEKVLTHPRKRSSKWISTSVPKHCWNEPQHQFASANYYVNNLLGTVLFEEGVLELPDQSIMIEIAPHGLLQGIVKKSMPHAIHIPLSQRENPNNLSFFLGALGKLYMSGQTMPIHKLYPAIQFPVSRLTPKISPLIKWQHSEDWFVANFNEDIPMSGERKFNINISDDEYLYLSGHQIDGRCLFPATRLLDLVWQTFAGMKRLLYTEMDVEFEDIRILRATNLLPKNELHLVVMIHYGTGRFEISEKSIPIATGTIRQVLSKTCMMELPPTPQNHSPILSEKDFYRELRIRGYQYRMEFCSVTDIRADGTLGKIKWNNNWVSFLDSMLQINIIMKDSRALYLPTRIRKMRINPKAHLASVNLKESNITVRACSQLGIIQAGGVEIFDMTVNPVSRRNISGKKIHASYNFIPQYPTPLLHEIDALRLCSQLAIENGLKSKFAALEMYVSQTKPIIDKVWDVLLEIPQIKAELYLMIDNNENIEMANVTIVRKIEKKYSIIIATGSTRNFELLAGVSKSLVNDGFLLSREKQPNSGGDIKNMGFNLIAEVQVLDGFFVLLQKVQRKIDIIPKVIYVSSNDLEFKWINELNENITKVPIVLVAQNDHLSGLLGFVNCLRKEPEFSSVRMVYINDPNAPRFNLDNKFYYLQLNHGCAINIYQNGKWGSYRHLELNQEDVEIPQYGNCYASLLRKGDLSSINWLKGPSILHKQVACVQYASLNFRDVMLATGKLSLEELHNTRFNADNLVGIEFSGVDSEGNRIMGMGEPGSLSTFAEYENNTIFMVPDSISLQEAATVPTVYLTVYYAFFTHNTISSGKSILIHAGSGGIGLAAIRVALAYNMEVFTTVSNDVKKKFVLEQFPSLKESHIGNSRDCSFERMVKVITQGKGVNFVLNSLSEDKLKASIRCLAQNGTFLEIGKFDMANNNEIGLESFMKELTFRSVMADNFHLLEPFQQKRIRNLIEKDLQNGIIKPLPATIFGVNEIEKAFRYLSSGKHVGKVVVKIRNYPLDKCSVPIKALSRSYFDPDKVYVIAGGLGGLGMELSDWMILRGARKIVLISRKGVTTGYQEYRIRLWKSYGCQIIISSKDITTLDGCQTMFKESMNYGQIDGIFNLAAILRDGTMDSQNSQSFIEVMAPKAVATKYIDQLSRKECPNLSYFVVFSSISCGQGNAGQSNYGMANSVMERIIEKRVLDGLCGKAIQWGAIGEVGLVAEMTNGRLDAEIAGTLQQPVFSCLTDLDILLSSPDPIVQCMITAENISKSVKAASIIDSVMGIMGIQDIKSIPIGVSLSDLGMDSLMATEILQTLEREFDLTMPIAELRSMTLKKLKNMSENTSRNSDSDTTTSIKKMELFDFKRLLENSESSEKLFYSMPSRDEFKTTSCLIFLHGVEGVNELWNKLALQIHMPTFMVNFADHMESIQDFVDTVFMDIMDIFKHKKYFYIVAYSFGSIVALEIVRRLETSKKQGHLIFVDTSPSFIRKLLVNFIDSSDTIDKNLQAKLASSIANQIVPTEDVKELALNMSKHPMWPNKLDQIAKIAASVNYDFNQSVRLKCTGLYRRLKAILQISWLDHFKIKTPITLIRSHTLIVEDMEEDYGLNRCTEGKITIKLINGNHQTILQNPELGKLINQLDPNLQTCTE